LEDWIACGDRLKQDGCCCGERETRPRERVCWVENWRRKRRDVV
jgi:hypothetical protein